MAEPIEEGHNWTCPTCGRHSTLLSQNFSIGETQVHCKSTISGSSIALDHLLIECPNPNCRAQYFRVSASHGERKFVSGEGYVIHRSDEGGIGSFTFLPTTAQPLSTYVPAHVVEDYNEAYLIARLSPKASATLARRALQGMVRDFFALPKLNTLHTELQAIKDKCDEALFDAIMAVKSVGNIGAHPERDVSLMVDVEPDEPETLLDLIHLLDQEWYVARAERLQRIEKMKALGAAKAPKPQPPA